MMQHFPVRKWPLLVVTTTKHSDNNHMSVVQNLLEFDEKEHADTAYDRLQATVTNYQGHPNASIRAIRLY